MKPKVIFLAIFMSAVFVNTLQAIEAGNIEIHGFISQGYLRTDKNNYLADTEDGTFQFNEMGINFATDLTDTLHIGMQLFARDLGDVGNDDLLLDWAFADYRVRDWLGFRGGRIKIDYGLYNETREMDMLRTSVMLPQSVYPELWRNSFARINGLALYGYVPLGPGGTLGYNGQIGAMEFNADDGFSRSFAKRLDETLDISEMDADYGWFANLQWMTPLSGLKAKASYYEVRGLKADGRISMTTWEGELMESGVTYDVMEKDGYVLSLEYTWENLVLAAEFAEDDYLVMAEFDDMPEPDSEMTLPPKARPKKTSQGWYVSGSYRFTDWSELGLSYSEYYPDADHKHGDQKKHDFRAWLKTTTLSARFDINDYWVLKLETSYNDGFGGITLADNPDELEQYWYLFAAKMTFSF